MSARRWLPALFVMTLMLPCARPVSAAEDFTFTRLAPYARTDPAMVYDSRRHRWLVIGGDDESGPADVMELTFTGPGMTLPHERLLSSTGSGSRPWHAFAAVYDSLRDRVYCVGGTTQNPPGSNSSLVSWVLDLDHELVWTSLGAEGFLLPWTDYPALVLDRARDRLVLFGGTDTYLTNRLWTLDLSNPTQQAIWQGVPNQAIWPTPRERMAFALEPGGQRMLIHGGFEFTGMGYRVAHDTWELVLSDTLHWENVSSIGPDAQRFAPITAVPLGPSDEILFTDATAKPAGSADTLWTFSTYDHAWRFTVDVASGEAGPTATGWDPDRHVVVGLTSGRAPIQTYDPQTGEWTKSSKQPSSRPSLIPPMQFLDTHHDRMLTWADGALWARPLAADSGWRALDVQGAIPPPRGGVAAAFDTAGARFMLVGSVDENYRAVLDSVRILTLEPTPVWRSLRIQLPADLSTFGYPTAVWDAKRARVLLVGGHVYASGVVAHSGHGDRVSLLVSSLSLTDPAVLAPCIWADSTQTDSLTAFSRDQVGAGIDPKHDRLYVCGGSENLGFMVRTYLDPWSVDLATGSDWRKVSTSLDDRAAAEWESFVYDPTQDRMIALASGAVPLSIAGPTGLAVIRHMGDADRLEMANTSVPLGPLAPPVLSFDPLRACMWNWSLLNLQSVTWPLPALTETAPAVADAASGRASVRWTLAGGAPGAADVERNTGDAWQRLATVHFGADGAVSYDDLAVPSSTRVGYRLALIGGGGVHHTNELWLGSATAERGGVRLLSVRPQPSSGPLTLELSLPIDANVTLDLYDLAGRRARSQSVALSAGRHVFTPSGLERVPPGLYLLRASALGGGSTRRVVILR